MLKGSGTAENNAELFLRRFQDLAHSAYSKGITRFTPFLNEREQMLIASQKKIDGISLHFYGGYENSVRNIAGIFPSGIDFSTDMFPIRTIRAIHGKNEKLAHSDVLGAVIAMGISRTSIGDIVPQDGFCRFVVLDTVANTIIEELNRIGRIGVSCAYEPNGSIIPMQEFDELKGTVSSVRADSLIKLLTNLSREKSAQLIKSGVVQKNYVQLNDICEHFASGDIFSVRGYGKFVVDNIGSPTKKGRLPVIAKKYR